MKKPVKPELSWKPVHLNETLLSGGIEGLIAIETLTDYEIENDHIKPHAKIKNEEHNSLEKLKTNNKVKPLVSKALKINKSTQSNSSTVVSKQLSKQQCLETSRHSSAKKYLKKRVTSEDNSLDVLPWTLMGVPINVAKALVEQGFKEPTEIQRLSVPPAIKGRRDILGAAETGCGKTLAFGLPIIEGILKNIEKEITSTECLIEDSVSESDDEEENDVSVGCIRVVNLGRIKPTATRAQRLWALVLTPTRELAVQVKEHLVAALKYTDIKVVVVVGGMSMEKQQRLLRRQPHIVVATPGRLWELISQGEPHFNNIEDIRYLAIDEADRMTEVNHFPELRSLLERINVDLVKQKQRQNFVFSATLTLVHELPIHVKLKNKSNKKKQNLVLSSDDKLKNLINLLGITNPKIIDVTKKSGMTDLLTESLIVCTLAEKDYYLSYFLQRHPGRTLVFCNSISCVRRLASLLSILGVQPLPLHANMIQKQRLKNLERFRDNAQGVLLATDVAARGLDIPGVEHVIHYQVPRTSETYVHRSGRTARANHEGLTLLLIETNEQKQYLRLMRTLNREKELPRFPIVSSLMDSMKQRVNVARDIDKMQLEYKKASSKVSWVERAAQDMDLLLDEDEMPERVTDRTTAVIKRQINVKKKHLNSLLKQPLTLAGFSYRYPSLNENIRTTAGDFHSSQTAIEVVKGSSGCEEKKRKRDIKPFKFRKKKFQFSAKND